MCLGRLKNPISEPFCRVSMDSWCGNQEKWYSIAKQPRLWRTISSSPGWFVPDVENGPSIFSETVLSRLGGEGYEQQIGTRGCVPSALLISKFSCLRSFGGPVVPQPSLAKHSLAAQDARRYMARFLPQAQIKWALHHQTLQSGNMTYEPCDKVLVRREKLAENRIGEWTRPYTASWYV